MLFDPDAGIFSGPDESRRFTLSATRTIRIS
jgi:hypothetical protein